MRGPLFKNRAERYARNTINKKIDEKKKQLINWPTVFISSIITTGIGIALYFLGEQILAFYLALAVINPLFALAAVAITAIVIIALTIFTGEYFFSSWLNSGPASDACTELLEEQIKQDDIESTYYNRITPTSKMANTVIKDYEKQLKQNYISRSQSLGIDIQDAVLNHNNPFSKFTNACKDAESFLSLLPHVYLESGASSEFSEEEQQELQAILKDHITMDEDGNAILIDTPDFIEGIHIDKHLNEIKSSIVPLGEFAIDSEISNNNGKYSTKKNYTAYQTVHQPP